MTVPTTSLKGFKVILRSLGISQVIQPHFFRGLLPLYASVCVCVTKRLFYLQLSAAAIGIICYVGL